MFDRYDLDYTDLILTFEDRSVQQEVKEASVDSIQIESLLIESDIKIGKLSELVFLKLFSDEMIDDAEINNLMLKDYSKETFGINYPVLAVNRTDNRGNSDKLRYKATPLTCRGRKYY